MKSVRYKAEPNTEVAGVNPDGSVIGPFNFDSKGVLELPDDFQEAHDWLFMQGFDPVKEKEKDA